MKAASWKFALVVLVSVFLMPLTAAQGALLAYYTFEGNANDVTGHGYDATVVQATLTDFGYQGKAYSFNGTSDYISIPLNINPGPHPQLTMGAWVQASATDGIRQVISHDNGGYDRSLGLDWRQGYDGSTTQGWSAFAGGGGVLNSGSATSGAWTFLAVVYDQAAWSVTLYVNNSSFPMTGLLGDGWEYTLIGSNPSFGEYFSGVIDNVFFFDEALTAAQIENIRVNGVPLPPSALLLGSGLLGLVGWRKLRKI